MSRRAHHHRRGCQCSICQAGKYTAPHQIIGRAIAARALYDRLFTKALDGELTCRHERRALFRLHRLLIGRSLTATLKRGARAAARVHAQIVWL